MEVGFKNCQEIPRPQENTRVEHDVINQEKTSDPSQ